MQRINAQYFYRLGTMLRPLVNLKDGSTVESVFPVMFGAESELETFLWNTIMPPVTSFGNGYDLYQTLSGLTEKVGQNYELTVTDVSTIKGHLTRFENVLAAEFNQKDTFIIPKQGIYSTTDLIEGRADGMFSQRVKDRVGNALPDINEAGKCLAMAVPTAAAFHLFRAVETVSKQYVTVFRGSPPTNKERTLGRHVQILRNTDADERVVNALDQMRGLHRNPVMHPEKLLSEDEVQATLGLATSLITAMVADMETKASTPDPVLTELLPDPAILDEAEDFLDDPEPIVSGM